MFSIDSRLNITLTKGDNAEIDVRLFDKEGKEVEILPSDVITITVRQSETAPIAFTKNAELNSIFITPQDTRNLATGLYVYDILLMRDDEAQTVIPLRFFNLEPEVTII